MALLVQLELELVWVAEFLMLPGLFVLFGAVPCGESHTGESRGLRAMTSAVPSAPPLNPNASAHGFTVLYSIINLDSLSLCSSHSQSTLPSSLKSIL